jgi:hypothetical protein
MLYRTLRATATSWKEYFSSLKPAFNASVFMAALLFITKWFLPAGFKMLYSLLILIAVGICSYAAALWHFRRDRVRQVISALSHVFKKE